MKKMVTLSLAALMSTATLGVAAPAAAQPGYYNGGYDTSYVRYDRNDRRYDNRYDRYNRRDYRNDRRNYRNDRRNYRQCDNGTGGTVTNRFLVIHDYDRSKMVEEGTLDRYGRPHEVASVVAFLASEAGRFVSGQVIRIDGGSQTWPA